MPLIGRKQLDLPAPDTDRPGKDSKESTIERGAEAVSNMPKLQSDHCISDWKRPHLSQVWIPNPHSCHVDYSNLLCFYLHLNN